MKALDTAASSGNVQHNKQDQQDDEIADDTGQQDFCFHVKVNGIQSVEVSHPCSSPDQLKLPLEKMENFRVAPNRK